MQLVLDAQKGVTCRRLDREVDDLVELVLRFRLAVGLLETYEVS